MRVLRCAEAIVRDEASVAAGEQLPGQVSPGQKVAGEAFFNHRVLDVCKPRLVACW